MVCSQLLGNRQPRLVQRTCVLVSFAMGLCLTVGLEPVEAVTYYVDAAAGDDGNAGTSTAPWRTLARAMINWGRSEPKVTYGDTVILRNGRYGSFALGASDFALYEGSLAMPLPDSQPWVTYKAEAGHTAVYFRKISLSLSLDVRIVAHAFEGIRIEDPGGRCVLAQSVVGLRLKNMALVGELDVPTLKEGGTVFCTIEFRKQNNDIEIVDCDIQGGYRGFQGGGSNFRIRRCNIHNTGVDKIMFGGGTNIVIENNRLHGRPLVPADHPDCIQFYTAADRYGPGASAENVVIRGNRMYDHSSQGLWTGGSVLKNVLFENNLMYKLGNYEWRVYGVHGGVIRNNTIIGDRSRNTGIVVYGGEFTSGELEGTPHNSDITVVNNLFACPYWGSTSVMTYNDHNIYYKMGDGPGDSEPNSYSYPSIEAASAASFVNAEAHDYRLREGAYAIDFGTTEAGLHPTDIDGNPRIGRPDAGCFESGAARGNHAPALEPIGDRELSVDVPFVLELSANDVDGDPLVFSASGLPAGASFSGRTFSWTPTATQKGAHQVTFEVTDGVAYDTETVTFVVDTFNAAPILSSIGDRTVNENAPLVFSVGATDPDGGTLDFSVSGLPAGATFGGQMFRWTPSYEQAGTYGVTFTVSDGRSQDSETVTISVANVNRVPAFAGLSDQSVDEQTALTFTVSGEDLDGDELAYAAAGLPAGASFAGQAFSWTPTQSQVGSHEVTFTVSDGSLQAAKTITLYVVSGGPDETAPVVARCQPAENAIQVPLNNLVTLHVTDAGQGVDPDSVAVFVNDVVIYEGDVDTYTAPTGRCSRFGMKNDYKFIYQPDEPFPFDHAVAVRVAATDVAGNAMSTYRYRFVTEMRALGNNLDVSGNPAVASAGHAATVCDGIGNVWVAWQAGEDGGRDIYVARRDSRATLFETPLQLTTSAADQCCPDLTQDNDGTLYAVWQDNRSGNWDIYAAISSDGVNWSRPIRVSDSDGNETSPAIAADRQSPSCAYVAWEDDRNGHADIYVASSTTDFASTTETRVTSHAASQTEPDVAIDSSGTVHIVWTDGRNGHTDIYGAASDSGPWTNQVIVGSASSQSSPALAAERDDLALHLVWVDDAPGDTDIYYASFAGLPSDSLTGSTITDDTSGANQVTPAIACLDSARVFACWEDYRHVGSYGSDSDLFLTDLGTGTAKTNVLVGDAGTGANQREPALGVDQYDNPYVVWADDREGTARVYYAATTFIDPNPLDAKDVVASVGATVGIEAALIDEPQDVSIIVPVGACQADVRMTIAEILNPQALPVECLGSYDFGPSGIEFERPVTVTIPYRYAHAGSPALPYWYDSLTGALSQQGITDIENLVISDELNALRFKTTHFTPFYLVIDDVQSVDDSPVGGGCSVSSAGQGSPMDLLVPYGLVALVMIVLRRRDLRRRVSVVPTEG